MIKRIYITNYKCLVEFEVELQPLQLILGDNGSGKSAMLEVLAGVRDVLVGGISCDDKAFPFPQSTLTRWQNLDLQAFEIDTQIGGTDFRYRLTLEHDRDLKKTRIKQEDLSSSGKPLFSFVDGTVQYYGDNHVAGPQFSGDLARSALANVGESRNNKKLTSFKNWIRNLNYIAIDPRGMASISDKEEESPDRNFTNFVAWYRLASDAYPDRIQNVVSDLQEIIDGFIHLPLVSYGQNVRRLFVKTQIGDGGSLKLDFSLDEISDGQRCLIALYALFNLGLDSGTTLCLDEPDNYVALREIQPLLVSLQDRLDEHKNAQVLIISHSPAIIDYLAPDCALMFHRENAGATRKRPFKMPEGMLLSASELIARGWHDE